MSLGVAEGRKTEAGRGMRSGRIQKKGRAADKAHRTKARGHPICLVQRQEKGHPPQGPRLRAGGRR